MILAAAVAFYAQQGFSWWVFTLLLFMPDLALLLYMTNPRTASYVYNLLHTYTLPLLLGLAAVFAIWPLGLQVALIWLTHIGLDRLVGYGLKYPERFADTHLGRV